MRTTKGLCNHWIKLCNNYVLSVWCHYLLYGYCIICAFMYCSCMQMWPTCGIGMLSLSMMFWSHSICTLCIFRSYIYIYIYIRIILVDGWCFFALSQKVGETTKGINLFFFVFLLFLNIFMKLDFGGDVQMSFQFMYFPLWFLWKNTLT